MTDNEALDFNYQLRSLDQGGLSLQCIVVRNSKLSIDDNMSDYKALIDGVMRGVGGDQVKSN